jgi:glycine cleavage system aminomethyltransferase T
MHILVGQDTDSESNAIDANMPWLVKLDKDDFVGKWSLEQAIARGSRERLVGFVMENGALPAEGGQIVIGGRPGGRVTSARWSPELDRAIGMAWVPPDLAHEGAELEIKVDGSIQRAAVRLQPFYDPDGGKLRS